MKNRAFCGVERGLRTVYPMVSVGKIASALVCDLLNEK